MDGFIDLLKKIKLYSAYPAVFVSAGLMAAYLLNMFGLVSFDVSQYAGIIFGVLFCAFTIYYSCKSIKKSAAAVCVILLSDAVFSTQTGVHFSLVFCVLLTLLMWLVFNNSELLIGFIISLFAGVLISVLFILINDGYTELLRSFAGLIKGRGAVFGVLSGVFNLFLGQGFDELFYHKAYSATTLINERIVSGAVDTFAAADSPQKSASEFLCGKYLAGIFIPAGIFVSLYDRLRKEVLFAFLFSLALSLLFGDSRIFHFMLLTVSPLLYIGSLILTFIAYTVCAFVDIRIGFVNGGNIIELFRYMDKPVYFILTGLITAVLSYFLTRLIAAKFNLLSFNELPRGVRKLVNSLGGRENILKVENGCVTVANPNLIDILNLDCEIHENSVTLIPDDFNLLKRINS